MTEVDFVHLHGIWCGAQAQTQRTLQVLISQRPNGAGAREEDASGRGGKDRNSFFVPCQVIHATGLAWSDHPEPADNS